MIFREDFYPLIYKRKNMHNSKTTFHLSHTDLDGSGCIIIAK